MLTPKEEKYVQNLIKGLSQRKAYLDAFPNSNNWKEVTVDNRASELFKKSEVLGRYNEIINEAKEEAIMSAKERMIWLTKVINGEITHTSYDSNGNAYDSEAYISDKLKSIDILNKMDNTYQQKIKVEGTLNNPYNSLTEEELRKLADK